MPKPFPAEFRRDVVAVARKHEEPYVSPGTFSGSPLKGLARVCW
jgi:hypothetical protein